MRTQINEKRTIRKRDLKYEMKKAAKDKQNAFNNNLANRISENKDIYQEKT